MNRVPRTLAACLLALISVSVVAQPVKKKHSASAKPAPIQYSGRSDFQTDDKLMNQFLLFMQLRTKLFTPPKTCAIKPAGVCVIEVPVILVPDPANGAEYCVALFPETVSFTGTTATDPGKKVVWSLIQPSPPPAGATFTFFDDKTTINKAPGIIILSDSKKQMENGSLGDGTSSTPDPTKYNFKNKHTAKGEAVYLPVVVRTDNAGTASAKVSMCGTPDPRIAND